MRNLRAGFVFVSAACRRPREDVGGVWSGLANDQKASIPAKDRPQRPHAGDEIRENAKEVENREVSAQNGVQEAVRANLLILFTSDMAPLWLSNSFATASWTCAPPGNWSSSTSRLIRTWTWPKSSGGLFSRRRAGVLFAAPKTASFPCSPTSRDDGAGALHLPRLVDAVRRLVALQVDPADALRPPAALSEDALDGLERPAARVSRGPVIAKQTTLDRLPRLTSWPDDGGPYITLPQVYNRGPRTAGLDRSNLGMYRVQLAGGRYHHNREVGLHYQLQRASARTTPRPSAARSGCG